MVSVGAIGLVGKYMGKFQYVQAAAPVRVQMGGGSVSGHANKDRGKTQGVQIAAPKVETMTMNEMDLGKQLTAGRIEGSR